MPIPDIDTVLAWRGRVVLDATGEKIGKFEELYLDTQSDLPEWAALSIGLVRHKRRLVPLSEAREAEDDLQVPFEKAQVESAPDVDAGEELTQEEEAALYRHYGLEYSNEESATGRPPDAGQRGGDEARPDRGAAETEGAAGAEQTEVGGGEQRRSRGDSSERDSASAATGSAAETGEADAPWERVRLRKYVTTQPVTKTVQVEHEEIHVEREVAPGDDAPER